MDRAYQDEWHDWWIVVNGQPPKSVESAVDYLATLWGGRCPDMAACRDAEKYVGALMQDVYDGNADDWHEGEVTMYRVPKLGTVTLYHSTRSDKPFREFSLDYVGRGVGTMYFGPGVYLDTTESAAAAYMGTTIVVAVMDDCAPLDLAAVDATNPSHLLGFGANCVYTSNDKSLGICVYNPYLLQIVDAHINPIIADLGWDKDKMWNKKPWKWRDA